MKCPAHGTIWSDQEPGTWASWSDNGGGGDDDEKRDIPIDDHIKKIAWTHVNTCGSCGGDCSPGRSKMILGKRFDNVCNSTFSFPNPNAEAMDCAKRMVESRIGDIAKSVC